MNKLQLNAQSFSNSIGSTTLIGFFIIAFILSSIFTFIDYNRKLSTEIKNIEKRLEGVRVSFASSLTNSLWKLDDEQTKIILESIINLDDLIYVEVKEKDILLHRVGQISSLSTKHMSRSFPLVLKYRDKNRHIADLTVYATTENVAKRLNNELLFSLLSEFIKIFIYGILTLVFIKLVITRHIELITNFFKRSNINESQEKLTLNRSFEIWKRGPDDLDHLVDSINEVVENLQVELHERKKTQKSLEALNQNLEIRVEEKTSMLLDAGRIAAVGEMAGGIAHEINSPLATIHGLARRVQKLCHQKKLNPEILNSHTEKMVMTIERIFSITNALQVLSKSNNELEDSIIYIDKFIEKNLRGIQEITKFGLNSLDFVLIDSPHKFLLDEAVLYQLLYVAINYRMRFFDKSEPSWMRVEFLVDTDSNNLVMTFFDNAKSLEDKDKENLVESFGEKDSKEKGSNLISSSLRSFAEKLSAKILFIDHNKDVFIQIRIPIKGHI